MTVLNGQPGPQRLRCLQPSYVASRNSSPSEPPVAHACTQIAGIIAGVLIYLGGRKTRRTKQVEERLRLALEIEGDIDKAKRIDSDTPTTIGVAVEAPQGPTDLFTPDTRSKITAASVSETNLATETVECVNGGLSVPIPEESSQPAERKKSICSLRFADEVIVPPAHAL